MSVAGLVLEIAWYAVGVGEIGLAAVLVIAAVKLTKWFRRSL